MTRQERMEVKITSDKSIRVYDSVKKTPISEWQVQSGNSFADTITTIFTNMKIWVKR